jgi:ABC-type glutathione transport system ATPase component
MKKRRRRNLGKEWEATYSSNTMVASAEPQLTLCIIGRSGSGKSFLINKLTKDLRRPVVVLNDHTQNPLYKKVEWTEVSTLHETCCIVEDIVAIDKKQIGILKKLLNVANHHQKVNVDPWLTLVMAHKIGNKEKSGTKKSVMCFCLSCV